MKRISLLLLLLASGSVFSAMINVPADHTTFKLLLMLLLMGIWCL